MNVSQCGNTCITNFEKLCISFSNLCITCQKPFTTKSVPIWCQGTSKFTKEMSQKHPLFAVTLWGQ